MTQPYIPLTINGVSLELRVAKYIVFEDTYIAKATAIIVGDVETIDKYTLFFVVQKVTSYIPGSNLRREKTSIHNQFNDVASDSEVLRGLHAISFISQQLRNPLQAH